MTQEEFHKRYEYSPTKDLLGEGGFGKVYKAYDTHLDRYVALKIAEVKNNYEAVRLKKEVELINKLPTHPNIAHYEECYSFTTYTGESDYGILQYYEHGNLQQLLTDKQLRYDQKDCILKQILEGIVFLHNQNIIHRDLKPQNILIALNQKGGYIPKITDFGISKKIDSNNSSAYTNSLTGVGTLAYASPEQLRGLTIRKNTDLWSYGVLVCWMFTGKLPFNSGSQIATSEAGRIELFRQINAGEVSAIISQLPEIWRNMVKQCIVVDYEKRINNAFHCLNILSGKINYFENSITIVDENTVTDIDGNVYKTVRIGNQVWMAENLRVSRYRNGDLIPEITDNYEWFEIVSGACCNSDNEPSNNSKYGKLYNKYAVVDKRSLAPYGWHISSDEEWEDLIEFLGGDDVAGSELKEVGNGSWLIKNDDATNNSGFSALPGGYRDQYGRFCSVGSYGYWWTSSKHGTCCGSPRYMCYYDSSVNLDDIYNYEEWGGLSVRCVRDF
jgi:uncharacterized protein (TIGR02145 family)